MRNLFVIFLIINLHPVFSQNQANIWYFGEFCGLDFNSGKPERIYSTVFTTKGTAVMCDSLGNLLFYSDGNLLYNINNQPLLNGDSLMGDDYVATQRVLIIKKPESNNLYYAFFVGRGTESNFSRYGLWYDVVDMDGDNGLGEIIKKNVLVDAAWDAQEKLFAVKNANGKDIWIITHKLIDNQFASFLLTKNGLDTTHVLNYATPVYQLQSRQGYMKISYDKKYFINVYENAEPYFVEVGRFNDTTGSINILYYLTKVNSNGNKLLPYGIEFSPDSRLLYLSFLNIQDNNTEIYQYDMQYIEDHVLFAQSAILIGKGPGIGLQLARDGKIYCSYPGGNVGMYHYVSVINKPWIRGTGCDYQKDIIYFVPLAYVYHCFPNILLDYLYRFEWTGDCSGPTNSVKFKPNFMFPDSIHWNFNDPVSGVDSVSHELSPTHTFSSGGEYEVSADVWYPPDSANPFGRYEHTSRVVTIKQSPLPDLGEDTLICKNSDIVLNGGAGQGSYFWSTHDFGFNDSLVTVSDTGVYWVKVNGSNGCHTIDSVNVGWHPPVQFVDSNMTITPTSCGGSTGSITGLHLIGTEPFLLHWQDAQGNILDSTLDISGLAVGNYFMSITDGNGCNTLSSPYTITDAGDIVIDTVITSAAHCGQNNGSITVMAHSAATTYFRFSINDGASFQENDNLFPNLNASSKYIRVSDTNGCQSAYEHNPVTIADVPGPVVVSVAVSDETGFDQNGSINITASGASSLQYSADNGVTFQDNGLFTGLSAKDYPCVILDEFGCQTDTIITVERLNTQLLQALAGDGHTCLGNAAVVPLSVSGFDSVTSLRAELTYDSSVLICSAYQNANPGLSDLQVQLVTNSNRVILTWQGSEPVSLTNGSNLTELIFSAKKEGYSAVDWAHSAGESIFVNSYGQEINTLFTPGNVRIFSMPQVLMPHNENHCENDMLMLDPFVSGGSGEYRFLWQGPEGYSSDNNLLWINNLSLDMNGDFVFTVTDTAGCEAKDTVSVSVEPGPEIAFSGFDTLFVNPGDLLDAGNSAAAYLWSTGDTTAAIVLDTMGIYSLQAVSLNGCKSFDTVQILWGGTPFFVPNAFSPNGDGLNDVFKVIPRYDYVRDFTLQIYSRWGKLIFESQGSNSAWDGTFNGQPVPKGVYVYRIGYRDFQTNSSKTVQGTVVVVR